MKSHQNFEKLKWIKDNKEIHQKRIKNLIGTTLTRIESFNKTYLLSRLGYKVLLEDLEIDSFDSQTERLLEYAICLALVSSNQDEAINCSEQDEYEILTLLSRIIRETSLEYESDAFDIDFSESEKRIRSIILQEFLHVRGQGYSIHIREFIGSFLALHESFFLDKFGFTSSDFLVAIDQVDMRLQSKLLHPNGESQLIERMKEWCSSIGLELDILIGKNLDPLKMFEFLRQNPDLVERESPFFPSPINPKVSHSLLRLCHLITPNESVMKVYELLSTSYGSNTIFSKPDVIACYPMNDSIHYSRPFVKADDKHYAFSSRLPFRNLLFQADDLIKNADANYHDRIYTGTTSEVSKDNFLEQFIVNLFKNRLSLTSCYGKLKYTTYWEGKTQETDLDVLVDLGDSLLIVEAKFNELSKRQRRGDLKGLLGKMKEIIGKSGEQCERAEDYIRKRENCQFISNYPNKGNRVDLSLIKVKRIYRIAVSYEYLSSASCNNWLLRDAGFIDNNRVETWFVNLYDLMAVLDYLNDKDEFLRYISFRLSLLSRGDLFIEDEMDVLALYEESGKIPVWSPDLKKLRPNRNNIDNYFANLEMNMSLYNVSKPTDADG